MDFYSELFEDIEVSEPKLCFEDIALDDFVERAESSVSRALDSSVSVDLDEHFELFDFLTPFIENDQAALECSPDDCVRSSELQLESTEEPFLNVSSTGTQCNRSNECLVETATQCDQFTSPLKPPELPDSQFYYKIMGLKRPPVYSRRSAEAVIRQWLPNTDNTDGIHLHCYENEEEVINQEDRVFIHSMTERISELMAAQRRKIRKYLRRQRNIIFNWLPKTTNQFCHARPKSSVHTAFKSKFPCVECYRLFATKLSLITHMKLHRKPFCTKCLDIYADDVTQIEHKAYCDVDQDSHSCSSLSQSETMSFEERQKQQLRSRAVVVLKELYPIKTEPGLSDDPINVPYVLSATLTQTGKEEYKWTFQYHVSILKLEEVGATTSFPISVKISHCADDDDSDTSFYLPSERRANRPMRKCRKRPYYKKIKDEPLDSSAMGIVRKYTTRSGRNVSMIVDEY